MTQCWPWIFFHKITDTDKLFLTIASPRNCHFTAHLANHHTFTIIDMSSKMDSCIRLRVSGTCPIKTTQRKRTIKIKRTKKLGHNFIKDSWKWVEEKKLIQHVIFFIQWYRFTTWLWIQLKKKKKNQTRETTSEKKRTKTKKSTKLSSCLPSTVLTGKHRECASL